jgi:hypothetical protein
LNASRPDDSFPYLHLSRRLCLPYARVLAYVELLDHGGGRDENRKWCLRECDLLEEPDMEQIMAVWSREKIRQGRAA